MPHLKLSCIVVMLPCITYCMQQSQRNSDAQRQAILQRLDLLQQEMADIQTDHRSLQTNDNEDEESLTGADHAHVQISIPVAPLNVSTQNQSVTPDVQQQPAKKSNAHEKKSHNKFCCFSFLNFFERLCSPQSSIKK